MSRPRLAVLLIGLVSAWASPVVSHAEGALRAGFGRAVITPDLPDTWTDVDGDAVFDPAVDRYVDGNENGRFDAVYMAGFQNGRAAAGVRDPLMALAVVFEDGVRRIGIVTADVVGLSHSFVDSVRAEHAARLGLDYLMIHATHNHEGPDTQGLWGESRWRSGIAPGYLAFLRARMGRALEAAVTALQPASLEMAEITGRDRAFGTVDTRRPHVIDDGLRVAIVRDANGDALGTLVNFGNHVELLWDRNILLTADVAGYARRGLEVGLVYDGKLERPGLGGTAIWLTGNIGGLVTTPPDLAVADPVTGETYVAPSFRKARAQGYAIAAAVLDAVASGGFARSQGDRLRAHVRDIELALANRPLVLGAMLGLLDRDVSFSWGFETASEVALLEVGDLWIACIPGELYPEIAVGGIERAPGADYDLEPVETPPLRLGMAGRVNMMVNLANDAIGYLIPKSQWDAEAPWLYDGEEETYGEIVSAGPDAAGEVHGALLGLFGEARAVRTEP